MSASGVFAALLILLAGLSALGIAYDAADLIAHQRTKGAGQ